MRDSVGTTWWVDGPDGKRVPIDPTIEFGADWPGHHEDEDGIADSIR